MAARSAKKSGTEKRAINSPHLRTSIGKSVNTRPKNKSKRRSFKSYRGQG